MSAPPSLFRFAPRHARKLSSATSVRLTGRPHLNVVTRPSRGLATVNQDQRIVPDVGFAGSGRQSTVSGPDGGDSRKNPDERTVKLGKSMYSLALIL